jgi:uncharacterized protein YbjT (DUF2867 family)
VLVTGSTGTVGREVVRALRERGVPLRAAVLDAADAGRLPAGTPWVPFSFEDGGTHAVALEGVERVFLLRPPHLAAARVFDPFLAAMQAAGVRQVVFLSLLGVEKNPVVPHHAIERRLRASGLPWTMLRPSFFMQNLTTTHLADLRRGEIVVPAGGGRTSLIDARDIGDVAALVLAEPGHEGRAYDLTGSEALTYDECARLLSRAAGRDIVYTRPSGRAFARHMVAQGSAPDFVRVMRGIYLACRLHLAGRVTEDVSRLLGRPPRTFAQFAADVAPLLADHPLSTP